jgi:hypothetical protein
LRKRFAKRRTPAINHVRPAFMQNKRCARIQRAFDGMVNRNACSVYQTDQVLIFIDSVRRRRCLAAGTTD